MCEFSRHGRLPGHISYSLMKELFDSPIIRTEQPNVIPGKYLGKVSENGT